MPNARRELDPKAFEVFLQRFAGDLGATVNAGLVVIGAKLGPYPSGAVHPCSMAVRRRAVTRGDGGPRMSRIGRTSRLVSERST